MSVSSTDSVLDVMRLMSEQGVSCVAVLQQEDGGLLSAISVTDIGKASLLAGGITEKILTDEDWCL